jgi:hypothetical protein
MLPRLHSYIEYRRGRWQVARELRADRRLARAGKGNFEDAAEFARSDQIYRAGTFSGRTRHTPPPR